MNVEDKLEIIRITQDINKVDARLKISVSLSVYEWFTVYIHHANGEVFHAINIGGEHGRKPKETKEYLLDFLEKAKLSKEAV